MFEDCEPGNTEGWETERQGGREGGREEGREGGRERVRKGGREGERGGREKERWKVKANKKVKEGWRKGRGRKYNVLTRRCPNASPTM